ncbi:outer membrane protein [Legionella sp. km772]|uniref:outer membrane protein n=1 Tax=Legionella sp. km772 TaxID=2498111 RepID=UPI000F8CE217|nr:outer membrane beta-barrel protein [Legionella sp. km772]RUR13514.1 hypothetical protein ELY15_02095 [Legionella sp. km772]
MGEFLKTLGGVALVSFLTSYSAVFAGKMEALKGSNWYLGALGSAFWASVPERVSVYNGAPSPYHYDYYSLTDNAGGAVGLTLGSEWRAHRYWVPTAALGLQYEHFFPSTIKGTITQYTLPQFANYSHSWETSADLLSLYTKLTLVAYHSLSPFINVGIGWAMNRTRATYETAFPGILARNSPGFGTHTQNDLAYNFGLGVDYALAKLWSVSLAYNYQYLGSFRSSNGVAGWSENYLHIKNYKINRLNAGITYHFG